MSPIQEIIPSYHSQQKLSFTDDKRAVTIGKFDACHLGHQHLIKNIRELSKDQLRPTVLTFKRQLQSEGEQNQLFTTEQQLRNFKELGIESVLLQDFDENFKALTHQEFFTKILQNYLNAQVVWVGENFCFGKDRKGTLTWLKKRLEQVGRKLFVLPSLSLAKKVISSSEIRASLRAGELKRANKMLGRPYSLEGKVVKGQQLGRDLGFPTANLSELCQLIPGCGVYAGYGFIWEEKPPSLLHRERKALPLVLNIGFRPSVSKERKLSVEAHFIGKKFDFDFLYGKKISLYLEHYLREEKRFSQRSELKRQISLDIAAAKKI